MGFSPKLSDCPTHCVEPSRESFHVYSDRTVHDLPSLSVGRVERREWSPKRPIFDVVVSPISPILSMTYHGQWDPDLRRYQGKLSSLMASFPEVSRTLHDHLVSPPSSLAPAPPGGVSESPLTLRRDQGRGSGSRVFLTPFPSQTSVLGRVLLFEDTLDPVLTFPD